MRRSTILTLILFSALSFGNLFAQRAPRMDNDGPRAMKMAQLDLTEQQQTQIDKLRLEHQKDMTPLRDEIRSLESEFRLMIIDEKASESKLKKQAAKISTKRTEMQLMRAKHLRQVRSLLTDEQKVKFDQHILSGQKKMGRAGKMNKRPGAKQKSMRRVR